MKRSFFAVAALAFLTACGAKSAPGLAPMVAQNRTIAVPAVSSNGTGALELANLDYGTGTITVFQVSGEKASVVSSFKPSASGAQGLAMDRQGNIYTTVTASNSKPCAACVEVFGEDGRLITRLNAPALKSAKNPPFLTDVSVDVSGNIYVSDYGQQAVYVYPAIGGAQKGDFVIAQNSSNAASVLSTPNGANVLVSGGCGFASVRPYTKNNRVPYPSYGPGNCFGIGTIALIGAAADNNEDVLTPVDGIPGIVAVSSPSGGRIFNTPGGFFASISGVAMPAGGTVAYVADHTKESVFVFARPAGGWLAGAQPKVLATYTGFKNLDIIAVRP